MEIFLLIFLSIGLFAVVFVIICTCLMKRWERKAALTSPPPPFSVSVQMNRHSSCADPDFFDSSVSWSSGAPTVSSTEEQLPSYYDVVKSDYTVGQKPFPEVSSKLLTYPPRSEEQH